MKYNFSGTTFNDIVNWLNRQNRFGQFERDLINITPASVSADSVSEQTFTIKRISTDDSVIVEYTGAQTAGVGILSARVSAADTLAISFINPTGSAATPAAGDYRLIRLYA